MEAAVVLAGHHAVEPVLRRERRLRAQLVDDARRREIVVGIQPQRDRPRCERRGPPSGPGVLQPVGEGDLRVRRLLRALLGEQPLPARFVGRGTSGDRPSSPRTAPRRSAPAMNGPNVSPWSSAMWVPGPQSRSPHVMSPSSTYTMWSLLWPWAWIIMPGSHSARSERNRGEKSSHFSRTDAVWSPKSILRTSSHGTSSSRLNRGPSVMRPPRVATSSKHRRIPAPVPRAGPAAVRGS